MGTFLIELSESLHRQLRIAAANSSPKKSMHQIVNEAIENELARLELENSDRKEESE